MFRKPRKKPQQIGTLIGAQVRINGDITFEGGLHLDGRVEGSIVAVGEDESSLIVGQTGVVEGSVRCGGALVNGTVMGDVEVSGRVELGPTARVTGNVVYGLVEMASGATVNGKLIHHATSPGDERGSPDG